MPRVSKLDLQSSMHPHAVTRAATTKTNLDAISIVRQRATSYLGPNFHPFTSPSSIHRRYLQSPAWNTCKQSLSNEHSTHIYLISPPLLGRPAFHLHSWRLTDGLEEEVRDTQGTETLRGAKMQIKYAISSTHWDYTMKLSQNEDHGPWRAMDWLWGTM